ncbi:hypothetical protein P43SY_005987 [Pythium insidiosum]|uniref:PH domain-containing protein n=1 Tax=Pythium insidiosum TaxID=114742 RepID=A0AAD5L787_PYTIN|nr:hypothetical protein P43SY_005987 [Pythium insidiosum]
MYRDGYLVRYTGDVPVLFFCVFGEGRLSMYSEKGGNLVSELPLAGKVSRVRVERSVPGKLPNRFTLTLADVGEGLAYEFAAPSNDLMKEWANTMHLWRRMNWKDNVKFFDESPELSHVEERAMLLVQLKVHGDIRPRRSDVMQRLRMPMMTLKALQATPSLKKLKERVVNTTSKSSCATTSTASAVS